MRKSTTAAKIDPSNVEQQRAWDGELGSYWAAHAQRYDEGVAAYHAQLLTSAAIDTEAKVLDIGCGTGQTTRDAARIATAGSVLGVDLSSQMIELARRLAKQQQLANATFEQADAHRNRPAGRNRRPCYDPFARCQGRTRVYRDAAHRRHLVPIVRAAAVRNPLRSIVNGLVAS